MDSETDSTTEEDMMTIEMKDMGKDIEHNDIIIVMIEMSHLPIEEDMIEIKDKEKIEAQGTAIMMETDSTK